MNTDSLLNGIAFLADSQPRLTVLRALTGTSPIRSQRDLASVTDLSPARVGRILNALAVDGWVVETDDGYRATSTGTVVAEGFEHMLERSEIERWPREGIRESPIREMMSNLRCLRDAEIVARTESDPPAVERRLAEWVGAAEQVRASGYPVVPSLLEATRHATVYGEQHFEAVLTSDSLDGIQKATSELLLAVVESNNVRVFVTEAALSVCLIIVDDAAVLMLSDEEDTLRAVIRTADPTVRGWAVETFETHCAEATWPDSDAFTV